MNQEDDILKDYLSKYPYHHETYETWPVQGKMQVRLSLSSAMPPAHVSSSILSIVVNSSKQILYLWPNNKSGSIGHLLIGGRPEGNETPDETAVREVAEETGWIIKPLGMIGFRHFLHTEPKSVQNDRPYPNFIQPIYAAMAITYNQQMIIESDLLPAVFWDYEVVNAVIAPPQRPLLYAAVKKSEQLGL